MPKSPWTRWGVVLGFALGGFFDGILLHQILQWHHLLSLVPGQSDMRTQILWDGYFHALMYVIAAVGLWGLWRAHRGLEAGGGRQLGGAVMIGFGLWHIVDSVLSHWVLGIHRIKLDSPNPLLWDLIWFAAFGLAPLLVGWLMLRRTGTPPTVLRRSRLAVLVLGALTAAAGGWAMRAPSDQTFTTVVFRPDQGPQAVWSALDMAGARLVWTDPAVSVVVVAVEPGRRWSFYRHGALLVSGSGVPAGCFDWSRA
jgi:uncharacterized membrane protein